MQLQHSLNKGHLKENKRQYFQTQMENKTLSNTRELVKLPPSEQHKVIHGNCDYLAIWL